MPVPHDLIADLHIDAERYQQLVESDADLRTLHKAYIAKDKEVVAAESNGTGDETVNQLRKARLLLKDKIERAVQAAH